MPERPEVPERLDSWKAIAAYLKRDIATVARWEKTLGLPVHRVAGSGRSVFAYAKEIDAWLQTARPSPAGDAAEPAPVAGSSAQPPGDSSRVGPFGARGAAGLAVLVLAAASTWYLMSPPAAGELRVEIDATGLVARDQRGAEAWRFDFPSESATILPDMVVPVQMVTGDSPAVYAITSHSRHLRTNEIAGGTISAFDLDGRQIRSFSFDDTVRYSGRTFGPPWGMASFAVDDSTGARRIAVVSHHYMWEPSLITILDEQWQRLGTFTHAGWVERVHWLASDRLVIGGFSQSRNGGMLAIVDAAALDGQGPEAAGTRYFCESCPEGQALRMVVMPRSEVNLVTGSRFNRAGLEVVGGRIVARTVEMPQANQEGDADAVYEFTPALELVSATFTDRYWEVHRGLEMQGKLDHTREECPYRDGPRAVQVWDRDGGWRTVAIR